MMPQYPTQRAETCRCHRSAGEKWIEIAGWLAAAALAGVGAAVTWLWAVSS